MCTGTRFCDAEAISKILPRIVSLMVAVLSVLATRRIIRCANHWGIFEADMAMAKAPSSA